MARVLELVLLALPPLSLAATLIVPGFPSGAVSYGVVVAVLIVIFVSYERSRPSLAQLMPIVVMTALAVVGRVLCAPFPDVKPVSALCIMTGLMFGRQSGLVVGALAALISNFFFGQGPWTPWQMYGWGLIGYGSGLLSTQSWFRRPLVWCCYGFFSGLVFGVLLNSWTFTSFVAPPSWQAAVLIYGAALPFDVVHGISTVGFLLVLYEPWREKLERVLRARRLSYF